MKTLNLTFSTASSQSLVFQLSSTQNKFLQYDGNWVNSWCLSNKCQNKIAKSINGNGKSAIKVIHCNFGPRLWINKIADLENVTIEQNPDFVFISEAKLFAADAPHQIKIEGYDLHPSKMLDKHGYTRLVLLSNPNIDFAIREEWMTSDTAAIWLSLKRRGQKRINIGGTYREHRLLLQSDDTTATESSTNI